VYLLNPVFQCTDTPISPKSLVACFLRQGLREQAQITSSPYPIFFIFCQSVTFLSDNVRGIMVVILSLTRKATKNIKY